ncbi:MAG TPA: AraC family transcriptional regulator [Planctomycetota bacterium]|nr:AraC family transcriptional regulator [Planctomycetota bacterium]
MAQPWTYETYARENALLPELPAVSWVTNRRAQPRSGAHAHPAYEVTYVVRGRIENRIGERAFRADAGQVFVMPPATRHGFVDGVIHPNEHCLVHVAFPPSGTALPGLSLADTAALAAEFATMAPGVFPGSPDIARLIGRLMDEHRHPDAPYAVLRARAALHDLLAVLARDRRRVAAGAAVALATSAPIRRALAWLDAHLADAIAFDALARRSGLSPTHFRRVFRREVGQTPAEWLARRRVERAKERLAAGDAVTDVAFALGFSSSQYFATVFKRYAGMSPNAWRRAPPED